MPLTEDQKKKNRAAGLPENYDPSKGSVPSQGVTSNDVAQEPELIGNLSGDDAASVENWGRILAEAERRDARGEAFTDEDRANLTSIERSGSGAIAGAGATANLRDQVILAEMKAREASIKDPTLGKYQGDWRSKAAGAQADAYGMRAMKESGNVLRGQMSAKITDREKAMMEMSRRQQERDQRASREATMANLRDRGFASSGDEIANMLGAQQETGERRMLEDMSARGQAVDRSLRATEAYGALGERIGAQSFDQAYKRGSAADIAQESSKRNRQQYDQFAHNAALDRNEADWGRTLDVTKASAGANEGAYNRNLDPWEFRAGVAGKKAGTRDDPSSLLGAMTAQEGARQAEAAAKSMQPDEGFLDDDIPVIGGWF